MIIVDISLRIERAAQPGKPPSSATDPARGESCYGRRLRHEIGLLAPRQPTALWPAAPGQQDLGLLGPLHGHEDRPHLGGALPLGSVPLVRDGCPYAQGSERRAACDGQRNPDKKLHRHVPLPRFPVPLQGSFPAPLQGNKVAPAAMAVKTWRPPPPLFLYEIDCCRVCCPFRNTSFTWPADSTEARPLA